MKTCFTLGGFGNAEDFTIWGHRGWHDQCLKWQWGYEGLRNGPRFDDLRHLPLLLLAFHRASKILIAPPSTLHPHFKIMNITPGEQERPPDFSLTPIDRRYFEVVWKEGGWTVVCRHHHQHHHHHRFGCLVFLMTLFTGRIGKLGPHDKQAKWKKWSGKVAKQKSKWGKWDGAR